MYTNIFSFSLLYIFRRYFYFFKTEHVRKILGDRSISSCMDLLEEIDQVRTNLNNAVGGPPPFKKHFDLARSDLKGILKSALETRMRDR